MVHRLAFLASVPQDNAISALNGRPFLSQDQELPEQGRAAQYAENRVVRARPHEEGKILCDTAAPGAIRWIVYGGRVRKVGSATIVLRELSCSG
jgi:hypothetical protein